MWISVITYSVDTIKANPSNLAILNDIQAKASLLSSAGLGGDLMPGYENSTNIDQRIDQEFVVIKRTWNTQEAAETFINYVNSVGKGISTAEIEIG
jgi:hypothetical protein